METQLSLAFFLPGKSFQCSLFERLAHWSLILPNCSVTSTRQEKNAAQNFSCCLLIFYRTNECFLHLRCLTRRRRSQGVEQRLFIAPAICHRVEVDKLLRGVTQRIAGDEINPELLPPRVTRIRFARSITRRWPRIGSDAELPRCAEARSREQAQLDRNCSSKRVLWNACFFETSELSAPSAEVLCWGTVPFSIFPFLRVELYSESVWFWQDTFHRPFVLSLPSSSKWIFLRDVALYWNAKWPKTRFSKKPQQFCACMLSVVPRPTLWKWLSEEVFSRNSFHKKHWLQENRPKTKQFLSVLTLLWQMFT